MTQAEFKPTLFDVAFGALKDAYANSRPNTEVNRILEEALNRIHNMPSESLQAEVETLREHLAEVNRLMSLNCRTVERLQYALRELIDANDDYLNGDTGFPFADALEKAKGVIASYPTLETRAATSARVSNE